MDSSLVQSLFGTVSDNIFIIIYFFFAVEIYLVVAIFSMLKRHENILMDVSDNLLKGFSDAPDKDSAQHAHEKIHGALQFVTNKMATNQQLKEAFQKNAEKIQERPFFNRHYKIETHASVMSTIVQVFPLLGILGTILAIAQTAFDGSQIGVSSLSNAFVLAMDTTILGISFSILFMVVESTFQPKIDRVIYESNEFRRILSSIYLTNDDE